MRRHARALFLVLAAILGSPACGGSGGESATTPASAEPATEPPATQPVAGGETSAAGGPSMADQVAAGQAVFDASCLSCRKYGSEGNELVGPFSRSGSKTAADLHAFIQEKMPKDDPGSLSDDQTWAVIAAILHKRHQLGDAALTPENAAALSVE